MNPMLKKFVVVMCASAALFTSFTLAGCDENEQSREAIPRTVHVDVDDQKYKYAEDYYIIQDGVLHKCDVYKPGGEYVGFGFEFDLPCIEGKDDILGNDVFARKTEPEESAYDHKCKTCFGLEK